MFDKHTPIKRFLPELAAFLRGAGPQYARAYRGNYRINYTTDSDDPKEREKYEQVPEGLITVNARNDYVVIEFKRSERDLITSFIGKPSEFAVVSNELRCYDRVKTVNVTIV